MLGTRVAMAMMRDPFVRKQMHKEFKDSKLSIVLWLVGLLSFSFFALWALLRYPILGHVMPGVMKLALIGGYATLVLVCFLLRGWLFPWATNRPSLKWLGIFVIATCPEWGVLGALLVANARLDDGESYAVVATIKRLGTRNRVQVSISPEERGYSPIDLSDADRAVAHRGSRLMLYVKPGRFGAPWIAGQGRVLEPPLQAPDAAAPPLPPRLIQVDDTLFAPLAVPATDPFGYPADLVDKRALLKMLRAGEYESLDRTIDALEIDVDRDIRNEFRFADAIQAFGSADSSLEAPLTAWIAARPNSAHARVARGTFYLARASRRQRGDLAGDILNNGLLATSRLVSLAWKDASAGLALDSTHIAGFALRLGCSSMRGDQTTARRDLDTALRSHPGSYLLRERYSELLHPDWGGSERALDEFAQQGAADGTLNPRLVALRGLLHDLRAGDAFAQDDFDLAVAEETNALAYGPEHALLLRRGQAYLFASDYVRALDDLERALAQRPQDPELLLWHAKALYYVSTGAQGTMRQSAIAKSRSDFELLQSLDPSDPSYAKWLTFLHDAKYCNDQDRVCRWRQGPT